jgi:pyridoxal 5'-phosphate synthase pdxT subunit
LKKIGILALQGDVEKHIRMIEKAGASAFPLKTTAHLDEADGLIIPGGESTTIGKLMKRFSLLESLKAKIKRGFPVFGTCAGAILLAKGIIISKESSGFHGSRGFQGPRTSNQIKLGVMDIDVSRNAYGPQVESFETDVRLSLGTHTDIPFRAVFIRAPIVTRVGKKCQVLGYYEDAPIIIREKNILIATFHPELTNDPAVHRYFLGMTG